MLKSLGKRFFDPCLELRPTQGSTMGKVLTKTIGENFDHGQVEFRGQVVSATFAHPEINVGQLVNMIEKPIGRWFATCMQQSWYMAPIDDLIKAGRRAQAAMNWLMRDNPKYWPEVIMIDKRGQPGDDQGGDDGGTGTGTDDGSKVGPDGWNDWDGDGFMSPDEWAMAGHNPADFAAADANGDGKISQEEYYQWLARQMGDHLDPALLAYLLQYSWVGLFEQDLGEAGASPSYINQTFYGNTYHSAITEPNFVFFGIYGEFIGLPVKTVSWLGPFNLGGLRERYYLIGAYNLGVPFECHFAAGLSFFIGGSASSGSSENPNWPIAVEEITTQSQAANLVAQRNNGTITIIDHGVPTRFANLRPGLYSSNKVFPGYEVSLTFYNAQIF